MKISRKRSGEAFTLVEVLIAITIFMMIITAIYSSWMSILRGTKIGQDAAKEVQRKRIAMRVVQDAIMCARLYEGNIVHYSFIADTSNPDFAALSFVARLPASFPRSGRYGEEKVRRVTFTVEPGKDRENQLVMRQTPVLRMLDELEEANPLVLAKNVQLFTLEFWDPQALEWGAEWIDTNSLPQMVRVALATNEEGVNQLKPEDLVFRIVTVAAQAVPLALQDGSGNNRNGRGGRGVQRADSRGNVRGGATGNAASFRNGN
jgi:type II secretion system protein J